MITPQILDYLKTMRNFDLKVVRSLIRARKLPAEHRMPDKLNLTEI